MKENLQSINGFTAVKGQKYVIKLLVMILSICHKHDETKQGMMVIVKTDMILYTTWKNSHESQAKFMWIFKAQVDKIHSHRRRLGYHTKIYQNNLTSNCNAENTAYEDATTKYKKLTWMSPVQNIWPVYLLRPSTMVDTGVWRTN